MVRKKEEKKQSAVAADFKVLRKPLVTEKTSLVGGDGSCVVFEVDRRSTKGDIRQAVERIFSVDVVAVRTANYIGKVKRRGSALGRTRRYKKAYVSLKAGQAIDVVEGL